ncbi:MAG TPA: CAP domain-containing protein [Thermomicrobiales bacterium]|nr:CAP domain-containing protein [Thermomicrobiales bacterium]
MRRLTLIALTLALTLVSALTLAPARPAAALSTGAYCLEPEEAAFLTLINQYRAQHGLPALATSQTVGAAAKHHSASMATGNYFNHTLLSEGIGWSDNMRAHGYTYNTYRGENIAAGHASAYATFLQWQNSPGHNANMLNPSYRVIGIGRAYSATATYGYYWTTNFGGYVDGPAAVCGQSAPVPPPVTAPPPVQQPSAPSTGGTRTLRGGTSGGASGGSTAPAPSQPTPSDGAKRSIR